MPYRLDNVAVLVEPLRRRAVQRGDERRGGSSQLELQQIAEQVVVPKPRPPHVERGDEGVRVLQALQDRL